MDRARGLVLLQRVWIESRSLSISSIIRFLDTLAEGLDTQRVVKRT